MTQAPKKPLIGLIILFVLAVALDQGTKQWAVHALVDDEFHAHTDDYKVCGDEGEEMRRSRFIRRHRNSVTVIEGYFSSRYVENCASAFGLMSRVPESFRFPIFLIVSLLAAAVIPYIYKKTPAKNRLML